MLEIGSLLKERYKILSVIGRGGMSVVYLAVDESDHSYWAVKEVRKGGVQNFELVKQSLIVETDLLKNLSHPNLPDIVEVVDTGTSFLIVMDYIEGKALDKVLKEEGPQKQEDVIDWAIQLCDLLDYLHSQQPPIIYRDMKPANVMLKPDGTVALIDFGTAREYKAFKMEDTTCLGTRGYAAPEQYGGHGQTDARTDIYCLGTTLYHLLTGHNPAIPPYEMYPIRHWNPDFPVELEEIILKCTKFDPEERYRDCKELLKDLHSLSGGEKEQIKENDEKETTGDSDNEGSGKIEIFFGTLGLAVLLGLAGLLIPIRGLSIVCFIGCVASLLISVFFFFSMNIADALRNKMANSRDGKDQTSEMAAPIVEEKDDGAEMVSSTGNEVTIDLDGTSKTAYVNTRTAGAFVVERSIIMIHTDEQIY